MTHTVYKLIFDHGLYYIGVTNNLKRRLYEHKGKGFLHVEILASGLTEEAAYELEKVLVPDHDQRDPLCINRTRGGRHPFNMRLGVKHTEETKKKISESKKANPTVFSDDHRRASSERMKTNNPMYREDIKRRHFEKTVRGENHPHYGKPGTMLGRKLKADQLAKISFRVSTPFGEFPSTSRAAAALGVSQQTVTNRCRSNKFPEWVILEIGSKYLQNEE